MQRGDATLALEGLRRSLAVVVLIEAVLFLFSPAVRHDLARLRLPDSVHLFLGLGEIAGCVMLLLPHTEVIGGYLLMFVFATAILIHLLHGMPNVGSLVIYSAAAWAVAANGGAK